jgi:hypothetical protein
MIHIYEKLGNYALDISKYVLTGVVIASFFRDMENDFAMLYIFGVLFSVLFMIVALFAYSIQNKRESIIKKKKK